MSRTCSSIPPASIVQAGQPLFRVYSPDIQQAQIDLLVAKSWPQRVAG